MSISASDPAESGVTKGLGDRPDTRPRSVATSMGLGRRQPRSPAARFRLGARESRHSFPFFPLSRYGPAGSSPTAGNADRAVLVDFT